MKKTILIILLIHIVSVGNSQSSAKKPSYVQIDYLYGNVIAHSPDSNAFLQGHPEGFILSWNQKNYGGEHWESRYNYPDFGVSLSFQDYKSDVLGDLYALYGHYNFYLLNRKKENQFILRTGFGISYNTNPYDKVKNNKNIAFGSAIGSSTYLKLYYQRENILDRLGLNAGITFVHASNANVKSPNNGVNTWAATLGVNYQLDKNPAPFDLIPSQDPKRYREPIKLNIALRGGVNESEYIGSGMKGFAVLSVYADKRLSKNSAIQIGSDVYYSPFLEDFYNIANVKNPDKLTSLSNIRIGGFIGYEQFINKFSVEGQIGYYIKREFHYQSEIYEALALKRYFNKKWFVAVRLKIHAANAETVEFGGGIRF